MIDRKKGKSKSRSMEGFHLEGLYDVKETIVCGSDEIVVSELDYDRK